MEKNIEPGYLYHYTSIETLALILKNKTIRLNNLSDMDDLEEGVSKDLGKLGRYVYASSWTKNSKESIPLWSLYTSNMDGVRIKLKANPFATEYRQEGAKCNKGIIHLENTNNLTFLSNSVELIKVGYTDKKFKLNPIVFKPNGQTNLKFHFKQVGIFKKNIWEFQEEWRYIIWSVPFKPLNIEGETLQEKLGKILDVIKDKNPASLKHLDLTLDDKALKSMEITCGPKVSEGQKVIIEALKDKYNPTAKVFESELQIRN